MGSSGANPSKPRPLRRVWGNVAFPSRALGVAIIVLRQLGALEALELGAYDRFIRWRPDEGVDDRFLVVGIDEFDIQTVDQYPLHDGTVADLLERLQSYNPRVIALDIARDIPQGELAGREQLREIVVESDRIITGCQLSGPSFPGIAPAPGTPDERVGFTDFPQDPSGVVRRSILVSVPAPPPENWPSRHRHYCNDVQAQPISLALASALAYLRTEGIEAELVEFPDFPKIRLGNTILWSVFPGQYGGYQNTGAFDYQIMLNYRSGQDAIRQVSLMEVMGGTVNPDWIEDRIVMVGYTSLIVGDFLPTPYLSGQEGVREMAGVVVHAQATSQIVSAALDQRPLIRASSSLQEWVWILLWAGVGGILVSYVRNTGLLVLLGVGAIALSSGIGYYQLFLWGIWTPVVPVAIALVVSMIGVGLLHQAQQGGYAQAIYEQLRDQLRAQQMNGLQRRSQKLDALEDLVQRARRIRQQRQGIVENDSEVESEAIAQTSHAASISPSATIQTQALYDEIKAKVEADLARERQSSATTRRTKREKKVQDLLERARKARQERL
ncbi:MAG: CHASE2 domain-containing protein [Leptolyngbyaceae cyanobacterium]